MADEPVPVLGTGLIAFPNAGSHIQSFIISASFLEIYNEHIYDLLVDRDDKQGLQIHESATEGVTVGVCAPFWTGTIAARSMIRSVL